MYLFAGHHSTHNSILDSDSSRKPLVRSKFLFCLPLSILHDFVYADPSLGRVASSSLPLLTFSYLWAFYPFFKTFITFISCMIPFLNPPTKYEFLYFCFYFLPYQSCFYSCFNSSNQKADCLKEESKSYLYNLTQFCALHIGSQNQRKIGVLKMQGLCILSMLEQVKPLFIDFSSDFTLLQRGIVFGIKALYNH